MADVWLTFGISQNSQSIPNNTSNVTVTVYANWRYGYYNKNNKSGTLTIDGTSYSFAAPFNTGVASSGSSTLVSKTVNVGHGSNGAKTLSVSASYTTGVVGTVSGSASKVLTTIPRVSDLSVNKTSVPADGKTTVTATATKKSTSFTDVLTVTLGSYSKTITSGTAFTIPMEWNNAITGTSAKATVKVETFSGSTSIGSKTAELTITVPDSVVPTINDADITEAVSAVTNAFGNRFVQNLSQLNVDVDASGAYGSTIRSYSISLDGVNYIQQAFTSNVIKTAGTLDVKVKVTDSRGRMAEDTFEVTVIEYERPAITSMVYMHCDSDGTQNSSGECTKITIAGRVYPVENQNTKALKLKYKAMADASYTERVVTLSDWTFSVDVMINNTDPTVTYEYIAKLTDKINAESPETFRVTTGIAVLSRHAGGDGVTFGGEAEQAGLVSNWDAFFKKDIYIGDGKLLDVGSLYLSCNPTSPASLFGGTWEQIKDRFLLAAGDTYSAGSTGGEAEHTLTINEMPSHTHSYLDFGYTSAWTLAVDNHTKFKLSDVSRTTGATGGGSSHNNMPPYLTVYVWKRVA